MIQFRKSENGRFLCFVQIAETAEVPVNSTVQEKHTQFSNNLYTKPNQGNSGWVPAPPKPKKTLRTGILKPIISIVLAVIFLTSSVFATVITNIDVAKATDKTTNAVIDSEEENTTDSDKPRYDASKITKPEVETTVLNNLVPDSAGANSAQSEISVIENEIAAEESAASTKETVEI